MSSAIASAPFSFCFQELLLNICQIFYLPCLLKSLPYIAYVSLFHASFQTRSWLPTTLCGPNLSHYLLLQIRFYWNVATPFCLHIVYDRVVVTITTWLTHLEDLLLTLYRKGLLPFLGNFLSSSSQTLSLSLYCTIKMVHWVFHFGYCIFYFKWTFIYLPDHFLQFPVPDVIFKLFFMYLNIISIVIGDK